MTRPEDPPIRGPIAATAAQKALQHQRMHAQPVAAAGLGHPRVHPYATGPQTPAGLVLSPAHNKPRLPRTPTAMVTPPQSSHVALEFAMASSPGVSPVLLPGGSIWEGDRARAALPAAGSAMGTLSAQTISVHLQGYMSPLTPAGLMNLVDGSPALGPAGAPADQHAEAKRQYHNQAEQRRRDTVKTSLEDLRRLVPPQFLPEGDKSSKMKVLNETVRYVRHLQRELAERDRQLAELRTAASLEAPSLGSETRVGVARRDDDELGDYLGLSVDTDIVSSSCFSTPLWRV